MIDLNFKNNKSINNFDLCGLTVKHTMWGEGTIKSLSASILSIHFKNTATGERSVNFQFPDAFTKGHLTVPNQTEKKHVEEFIESCKCVFCGRTDIESLIVDNIRVCVKCKKVHTAQCPYCHQLHIKDNFEIVNYFVSKYSYYTEKLCKECITKYTYECSKCTHRYLTEENTPVILDEKKLCQDCFKSLSDVCYFCKKTFNEDDGDSVYTSNGYVNLCPDCVKEKTFECTDCGSRELLEDKAISKFIHSSKNICFNCTKECSVCGELIDKDNINKSFDKCYCPDCWEQYMIECSICGDEFVPNNKSEELCPDCVNMKEYEKRIMKIDFSDYAYKVVSYYSLGYIYRCSLFTKLYENNKGYRVKENLPPENDYKLIVMDYVRYKLLIAYLPRNIVGNVRNALNVTMTKFRSKKHCYSVYKVVKEWLPSSSKTITTQCGDFNLLAYPILLRVQTDYDKCYGKEWYGPNDYIEIGNYGDTTNFYIIGAR